MRLVFAGTPETALPSLRTLIDSPRHEVVAVVTRPDAQSGRGRKVHPSPVAELAEEAGIEVLRPQKAGDPAFLDRLRALEPDCCPVVAYGALLPQSALDVPRHGWINLHFSILPAWRGAAPVQHAILHGDEITGASTFQIVKELDAGPVYGVVTEEIRTSDTSGRCWSGCRCRARGCSPPPSTASRTAPWRPARSPPTASRSRPRSPWATRRSTGPSPPCTSIG